MKKNIILFTVITAILALIVVRLISNHDQIEARKTEKTDLSYVTVSVSPVTKMKLDNSLRLVGYMDAWAEVNVPAEAGGRLTLVDAEPGQVKQQGSVIATTDDQLKQLAVRQAQLSVDKLEKDLVRSKNLFNGGTLTEQQLEQARNSYDEAVIRLEQARKQLSDATVRAPLSGTITKKYVEQGEYINTGSSVVTMVDISRLRIKMNVSESDVYLLKRGDKAIITTDVYPGVSFEGTISFISSKGDEAHNYPVEIVIFNNTIHPLKSGTFAKVEIRFPATVPALYIPREALQGSINDAKVYVAGNGKALLKNIVVTDATDQYLRVISGLDEGEQVIVTGQVNLSDGKSIKIIK